MILIKLLVLYIFYVWILYDSIGLVWTGMPAFSVLIFASFISFILYGLFVELKWIFYLCQKTYRKAPIIGIFDKLVVPILLPVLFSISLSGVSNFSLQILLPLIFLSTLLCHQSNLTSERIWDFRKAELAAFMWKNRIHKYLSLPDDGVVAKDLVNNRIYFAISILVGMPVMVRILDVLF